MDRCLLIAIASLSSACGLGEVTPWDPNIPLEGSSIEPGALAGTFALKLVVMEKVLIPIFGEQDGGGESWFKVERSWDAASETYTQVAEVCGGNTFDVLGTKTTVTLESWRSVPPATVREVIVDHDVGGLSIEGHLELWGLELEDAPETTPLPEDGDEAREALEDAIVDTDGDGNPGITAHLKGLASGDVYFIMRRVASLSGVILDQDHVVGLNRTIPEKITLGATNSTLNHTARSRPHPDAQKSWFEEVRIEADTDCIAITAMIDDGTLGATKPF